jgi:formylmethanofuran dehydrogenase subunit E
MQIGSFDFDEFLRIIRSFHGSIAPGVLVGGIMVEMARDHLPEEVLFDALCETSNCLPDAVQLLTPCSIGNGWLKVVNVGRFALALYDKYQGEGVRVFLDPQKIADWSEIQNWYLKLKPKKEQDSVLLIDQIKRAGQNILGCHSVKINSRFLQKRRKGPIGICPVCREAYPIKDGDLCRACQGETPYVIC